MPPRLFDAHNHLQDERLLAIRGRLGSDFADHNISCVVVNGSAESDWGQVLSLAREYPQVLPSFGYHPWYVGERSSEWRERLLWHLDQVPSAIGEVGLDRWVKDYDLPAQEQVFTWQLRLAAERNLPVTVHCLNAWGRVYDLLRQEPRPACGFLLHSYGGPREMVKPLAELGAYFSFPGYFALERKSRQRESFMQVPRNRLLIETDAPDQLLPEELNQYPLMDPKTGKQVNHPANLGAVYEVVARMLEIPFEELATLVEGNFRRLFAEPLSRRTSDPKGQGNPGR